MKNYIHAFIVLFTVFSITACDQQSNSVQAQGKEAPSFEVDPFWPKPLPNHWILGSTIGLAVDSKDHVFIIHRRNSFNERTEIAAASDPKLAD